MSELGADAQGLVLAGRGSLGPNPADRERIARALQERLALLEASHPTHPAPAGVALKGAAWKGIAFFGSVLAVGGAVVALSAGHGRSSSTVAAPPAALVAADSTALHVEDTKEATASSATPAEPQPLEPRATAAQRRSNRLAEEVSILSRAETELHAGRPANALELLDEHRRKFPNGALVQERIAARIHALCALGRTTEAESELARLKRVSPGSPQEPRAREACAPGAKG